MIMADAIEYALMAGAAYVSTRNVINQIPIPPGWTPFKYESLDSGFEAVSFQQGNDIVISFAGTGPGFFGQPDWLANINLATGLGSVQLDQAADYYLQVEAANPGANISFTGHSLGGGLASLMAVFFNQQAVTFDQAPFAESALTYTTVDPETGIVTTHSVAQDLLDYLSAETTNGQHTYTTQQLMGLTNFVNASVPDSGVIPNASNVTDINVQGEVLSYLPYSRIGTQTDIPDSAGLSSTIDLHSQTLLTAFLLSNQAAAPQQSLSDVTFKLADLLGMIFNSGLFYNEPNNTNANAKQDFLELLVQHQEGFSGVSASGSSQVTVPAITADNMITRFTSDLQLCKLGSCKLGSGLAL